MARFFKSNSNEEKSDSTIIETKDGDVTHSSRVDTGDSMADARSSREENFFFSRALIVVLATLLLMLLAFAVGFFSTLRGAEKTVIPNVVEMELTDALIAMQEKGLNTHIQVKYTDNSDDKGLVMDQSPASGQSVKAGRRVTLVVSLGAVIEKVGDYSGMTLDELKLELQTIFASYQAMIQIGQVVYEHSEESKGQIIAQDPEAGSDVTGLTQLNLIISRGMEEGTRKVENYTGMSYSQVIDTLIEEGIPFLFHIDEDAPAQSESVVFRQEPAIGEMVSAGTPLEFYINRYSDRALSNLGSDMVLGILEFQLPQYMVPMKMTLRRTIGATDPELILEMRHPGGAIAIPYLESEGTILSLYVNGKEQIWMTVGETP